MMSTAKNRLSTASQSSLRSLSGGSPWSPPEKHYDDYDDTVLNRAGSTLAVPYFGPKNGVHLTDDAVLCGASSLDLTLSPFAGRGWRQQTGCR
jgi:hypothetical protein